MSAAGNRNSLNREIGADGKRDWSFKLNDYKSARAIYNQAFRHPHIFYSQNKQRFRHLEDHGVPLSGGGERYNDDCRTYFCLTIVYLWWYPQASNRRNIRRRYGIRGSFMGDCYASCCCVPCALVQERREIELEEESFY
ncbi:PLAC8 family-domain-containing protein [Russula compacta]|nr:PLAC8 family-domain-containing protein [Russula compacta]